MDERDSGTFTLAKQGSITFIGNILGRGLGLLFVIVVTRLVSPSIYGVFTLSISIISFIQGFASLNLYRSIDYYVPQYLSDKKYDKAKGVIITIVVVAGITSTFGMVLVYIFTEPLSEFFNEPLLIIALPILSILILINTWKQILLASFNSIKKLKYRVLMKDVISPVARISIVLVLLLAGWDLLGLVATQVLGITIAIIFGGFFLFYEASWIRTAVFRRISSQELISYSLPLMFAGIIYSIVGQIDYFMIGRFMSSADVGYYRVAFLISSNLLVVLSAITPVFKPMISEHQQNTGIIQQRFRLATRWVTMLTIPIAITFILAPHVYLAIFFTAEYAIAGSAVIALTLGYLLNATFGPEGMMLEGLGFTRLTLLNTVILVTTNVVLDVLLVPRIGILGAGIGTAIALTIAGIAGIIEIYYLRRVHPFTVDLLKLWLAGSITICISWLSLSFVSNTLLTGICLPVVVVITYLTCVQLLRGYTEDDAAVARKIDSKVGYPVLQKLLFRK